MLQYVIYGLIASAIIIASIKVVRPIPTEHEMADAFKGMLKAIEPQYVRTQYKYNTVCHCAQCDSFRRGNKK